MSELERTDAAVRREVGIEYDELGMFLGELKERLAVGRGDVLVRDRRSHRCAGLGFALETVRRVHPEVAHMFERQLRQAPADALDELAVRACERVVVRRS